MPVKGKIRKKNEEVKRTVKFDYVVSITAIILSVLAFIVSYYQTEVLRDQTGILEKQTGVLKEQVNVMAEQQHASVWPAMLMAPSNSSKHLSYVVRNDGVGPAIIVSTVARIDGKVVKSWKEIFKVFNNGPLKREYSKSHINKRIVRQGTSITAFSTLDKKHMKLLMSNIRRLEFTIHYKSIYGRLWRLSSHKIEAKEISAEEFMKIYNEDDQFLN